MKKASKVFRNALAYYFLLTVFTGVSLGDNSILSRILFSLIVGLFLAFVPEILKFIKLPVTYVSAILISLVVSYIFHFLVYTRFADLGFIGASRINFSQESILLIDSLETFVLMGLTTAILVVTLDWMSSLK